MDDVLALAFALLRPELSVRAITAVSYATELRCHLLRVLERADVPFAPDLALLLRTMSSTAPERERVNALNPAGYILNHAT